MFTIGEFSKIVGMTVKTLRHYHEQGVLLPTHVDGPSGYRYYAESKIETAQVIKQLRELDFTLADIAEILIQFNDDADILDYLEKQQKTVQEKMKQYRDIGNSLNRIINKEREARTVMSNVSYQVEEKTVDSLLVAGIRMKGKYSECGKGFGQIGRKFGRHLCGKPLILIYDTEYKEDDADFEVCMPIKKEKEAEGISVRTLAGGKCISLLHPGPYDTLSKSYAIIFAYQKEKGYEIAMPTREVYIKGPGMIFKGNPMKYRTVIQMLIQE